MTRKTLLDHDGVFPLGMSTCCTKELFSVRAIQRSPKGMVNILNKTNTGNPLPEKPVHKSGVGTPLQCHHKRH